MNRDAHIAVGAAGALTLAALPVSGPVTIPACLCAVAGGALGGWVPDVDIENESEDDEGPSEELAFYKAANDAYDRYLGITVVAAVLLVDLVVGDGACHYVLSHLGPRTAAGALALLALLAISRKRETKHRTLTHSVLGLALFTAAVALLCLPLHIPFFVGMALHIALDLLNKKPVHLLFPFKIRKRQKEGRESTYHFYLGLCKSNGRASSAIRYTALSLSIVGFVWLVMTSDQFVAFHGAVFGGADLGVGNVLLVIYLPTVNVAAFLAGWVDLLLSRTRLSTWPRLAAASSLAVNTLVALGGGVGFLVTLLTAEKKLARLRGQEIGFDLVRKSKDDPEKDDGNAWWYVYTVSAIVCTLAVVFGAFYPVEFGVPALLAAPLESHVALAAWLAVMNVAAFFLFLVDKGRHDERLGAVDVLIFVVAALGGSLGFMLAMGFLNTKRTVSHFEGGMPLLLTANAVCAATLLLTGIA